MTDIERSEDPEPSERGPAGPLHVPVRSGPAGCRARFFRTPLGGRTAVGFTSQARLAAVLGPDHPSVRLSEGALRSLAEPLGVTALTVDPRYCAPAPAAPKTREGEGSWRDWDPQHVGALRVVGAAAAVSLLHLLIG
ncbi:SAV_915 family protein [Streptomyces sp. NPDC096079]|uniref:SAV_915 family protein n=1 Tax=unclassified Streptomyces TaxID=2593676 RepID=UPI00332B2672